MKYYLTIVEDGVVNKSEYKDTHFLIEDFLDKMESIPIKYLDINIDNIIIFSLYFRDDRLINGFRKFEESISYFLILHTDLKDIHYNEIVKKWGYEMLIFYISPSYIEYIRKHLKKLLSK